MQACTVCGSPAVKDFAEAGEVPKSGNRFGFLQI